MNYIEFLNSARNQVETIRALEQTIEKWKSERYRMTSSPDNLGVQNSGGGESWEDKTCKIADKEKELSALIQKKYEYADNILKVVDLIPSDILRAVLIYRYVSCMSWEEIVEELNYSPEYTRGEMHQKAKEEFRKVYENKHLT